jgi:4-azaleucine resistance transporter AzlC
MAAVTHSRGAEFAAGLRDELPLLVGVAPFGVSFGAYAVASGVSAPLAQAMSVIIFGGASQFIAVQAFAAGAPAGVIVFTVALVNLRHLLYGAALAPHLATTPRGWRAALAYLMTDEAYVVTARHFEAGDVGRHGRWYMFGAGIALWTCWQLTTAVGLFIGDTVPDSWALDFALPVTFIAIAVPAIRGRGALAAAVVAGVVAVLGHGWTYETGLIAAILAGIAAGVLSQRGDAASERTS